MTQPILVNPVAAHDGRRLKLLLALAVAILAIGALGPRLLFGGGGGDSAENTAFFPDAGTATTSTTVAPTSQLVLPVTPQTAGRNPFSRTVVVAAPAPAVAPVATTVPSPPPASPTGSTARLRVLEISLDGTQRPIARIRLNDVAQTVTPGQAFGSRYSVVSLDVPGRCGRFLAGGVRFSLCEGDERLA